MESIRTLAIVFCVTVVTHAHWSPTGYEVIDMTYEHSNSTMFFPGSSGFHFTRISRGPWEFGGGWLEDNDLCAGDQGTHLHAPAHFGRGKWYVHDIPPHRYFGPVVKVDISDKTAEKSDYNLRVEDLENWERINGRIPDGAVLLVFTGWGKFYDNRTAYYGYHGTDDWQDVDGNARTHFPGVSEDAAKWIAANRAIYGIGIDSPSIGPCTSMLAHVPLHDRNIYNVDNVKNMELLPPTGYSVAVLPISIRHGSGAPVRIVAFKTIQFSAGADDVVDLTYPLHNGTLMWPGRNPFQLYSVQKGVTRVGKNDLWVEKTRYCGPEHMGTHLDTPAHFTRGSWRVHQIPAHTLITPGVRLDIHERAAHDRDAALTVQEVKDWEEKNGRIPENAVVFLYTGYGRYINDFEKYMGSSNRTHWINEQGEPLVHYPGFSSEAADYFVRERNVQGVGIDAMGYDVAYTTAFPAHVKLLGARMKGLENIANVGKLPEVGFTVFSFPMLITDGSGAPTRVIAVKNSAIKFPKDAAETRAVGGATGRDFSARHVTYLLVFALLWRALGI